jgi:hypothetical protein
MENAKERQTAASGFYGPVRSLDICPARKRHHAAFGGLNMIPNPRTAADALSVTDGAITVGYVVERDGSFFAFDVTGTLVGEYGTRRAAVRSIPRTERGGKP